METLETKLVFPLPTTNFDKYVCMYCDYYTHRKHDIKKHFETRKHWKHLNQSFQSTKNIKCDTLYCLCKNSPHFVIYGLHYIPSCNICNYKYNKGNQQIHTNTNTNTNMNKNTNMNLNNKNIKIEYKCSICNKSYKNRSGLYKHNKTKHTITNMNSSEIICHEQTYKETTETNDINRLTNLVELLVKENKDLQTKLVEISNEPKIINNNINNIHGNKQFNIITYLNKDCKDAFNLSEFITNINITFDDLEYIEKNGYVSGIRDTFIKLLANMDESKRPIHCTDRKRKQFYVKDNNEWDMDLQNEKIKSAIDIYNSNQLKTLIEYKKDGTYNINDKNKTCDLVKELTKPYHENSGDKFKNKIINEISNVTTIDKQSLDINKLK